MPRLVVLEGPERGKVLELGRSSFFVGRSQKNDLVLTDRSVSSRHMKLFQIGRKCFVEDLKSTNGTRVNHRRLDPGEGFELDEGDRIRLGRVLIRIEALPARSGIESAAASSGPAVRKAAPRGGFDPERRRPGSAGDELMRDVSRFLKLPFSLQTFGKKVLVQVLDTLPRTDTAVLAYIDPLTRPLKHKTLILYTRPELGRRRGGVVSERVIDHVLEREKPVRLIDVASHDTGEALHVGRHQIRSILCLPLVSNAVLRGALYVHSTMNPCGFRREDLLLLDTVGTILALVFENALGARGGGRRPAGIG
jgi:hypothetical protein